jgi:hypothetical protein
VALFLMLSASASAEWRGSPNGFPKPWCTWYVDGRCTGPQAGSIMVLGGPYPEGHVAYVECAYSGGNRWRVTHAAWPSGSPVRWCDGVPIYQAEFEFVPGTRDVRLVGGSKRYPLLGFVGRAY